RHGRGDRAAHGRTVHRDQSPRRHARDLLQPAAQGVIRVSTATAERPPAAAEEEGAPPSLWRTITSTIEGRLGLAIGAVMIPRIIVGPALAPYNPTTIATGPALSGPSASHILGTDQLGRDVLSRFLSGGRSVLIVPLIAVVLSFVVGGGLGLLGAYRRGLSD